ncbi:transcriptional regulator [Nocardiopsis sp. MG754419]|uniref:transcriptional regulator n=1 Tax=Nocardiopsis sp. MG754419 TaxID=2259865 RepID=UPI001BA84DE1|nr:transcriptional regulator [Nocardiopsis sp. MG754419]MBR8744819.1 transcriptional regulator [Nocardiopsis sp. MG754419]
MRPGGTPSGTGSGPVAITLIVVLCVLLLTAATHPEASAVPAEGTDDGMAVLRGAAEADTAVAYTAVRALRGPEGGESDGLDVRVVNRPGTGLAMAPVGAEEPAFVVRSSSALETLDERLLAMLEHTYRVVEVDPRELDGRRARVVEARRADGTVAGRFWVDDATDLLLGRDVLDHAGGTAFSSRLTDLTLGDRDWPEGALGDAPWGDVLDHAEREGLRAEGWKLSEHLAWNLRLVDARSTHHEGRRVVHTVYSDGLSQISVFVQRGKLGEEHLSTDQSGYVGTGPGGSGVTTGHETIFGGDVGQYQSMWQANGFVYTVLADAPADLASSAVSALPGPEGSSEFWARVQRGLSRLGLV